jgi:multiple antibiotic resistance protein
MNEVQVADIFKVTLTLFTVIDVIGVLPLLIDITRNTGTIHAERAAISSFGIMLIVLFIGESFLKFLGVTKSSFAVAGGIILFILAMEMILGRNIIKQKKNDSKSSSIVPVAFPLISGAGTMTTILSLKSSYNYLEMATAIFLNVIIVYVVLKYLHLIEKRISENTILVMRKMFGVILLAIAVGMISKNLGSMIIWQTK